MTLTLTETKLTRVAATMSPKPLPSVVSRRFTRRRFEATPAECAAVLRISELGFLRLERDRSLFDHAAYSQLLQALEALGAGIEKRARVNPWERRRGARRPAQTVRAAAEGDAA